MKTEKWCPKHQCMHPIEDFQNNKSNKDGKQRWCRQYQNQRMSEVKARNKKTAEYNQPEA